MANSKQAKKRARQTDKRNLRNSQLRSAMRTSIKKVKKAVELKDTNLATESFKKAMSEIDKMASKGLVHKNTAARYKSRLSAHIKALAKEAA